MGKFKLSESILYYEQNWVEKIDINVFMVLSLTRNAKSSPPTFSYERKVDLLLITSTGCSPTISTQYGINGGKTTDGFDRKKSFF